MSGNYKSAHKVNIVGDNYGSRYGTSIYKNLYGDTRNSSKSLFSMSAGSGRASPATITSNKAKKAARVIPVPTTTLKQVTGPSGSASSTSLTKISDKHDGASTDTMSINTETSRKSKIKRKYKSLLSSSSKKLMNKIYDHHPSSDTFSIFSNKTSHSQRSHSTTHNDFSSKPIATVNFNIADTPLATINELPVEIITHIISNINDNQISVVKCLYVSKKFYEAAKVVLYENPFFTSTYRVAQFVTSLRLNTENGHYVKNLDLSQLKSGIITQGNNQDKFSNSVHTATEERTNANTSNNNTASNASLDPNTTNTNNEITQDIAYASWRDWRHRNDPLYSAPLLNSYNLKRVNSRSSSIHSTSSNGNTSTVSSKNSRSRHRSNSSVSSFTSSIMSSLQNSTITQPNPTNNNSPLTSIQRMRSASNVNDNSIDPIRVQRTISNNSAKDPNSVSNNISWFRMRLGSRQKKELVRSRKNSVISSTINEMDDKKQTKSILETNNNTTSNNNNNKSKENITSPSPNLQLKVKIEEPFKTRHPYTNKFLLKYAPYRDLPLGYILHLLKSCPNLTGLNLSNLVLFTDFQLVTDPKKKTKRRQSSSLLLLPTVEEGILNHKERDLETVYMTDSSKNYEYYENLMNQKNERRSSMFTNSSNPSQWMRSHSTVNWNDNPLPIDGQTKLREEYKNNNLINNDIQLRKLNPCEIFEIITTRNVERNNQLKRIKMDGVVWCRQYMIKYFILNTFDNLEFALINDTKRTKISNQATSNPSFDFSFTKSGLNRNFAWACKGDLFDFVSLIVLDDLLGRDDLELEDLFRIKKERLVEKENLNRDPDVLEVSEIFEINYGKNSEDQETMNFRLTILKSDNQTTSRVRKITPTNVSLVVNLNSNEDFIPRTSSNNITEDTLPEAVRRVHNLTNELVSKIRDLRSSDLRRNIGENNYIRERVM
ncbi:Cos111p NDAI_0C05440 [Naumovozyma dairenensis CBS 421]|uniref:F-box domain-containing protein n=1 Tax=Naumovozyma dairenensis (strain ATCC 10597 / BCRC 20456 / CBS 421 / NBRC 0211 / NRRL Y-12639) TaxID=1071378 RepID=G0W8U2_NAUDC|nr:hypothetical protein NDAI_0C05440 [Naumovozyma dairenensis CBS 421]CCD24203.1 hypothetical protein NDAI_0C05440 [Naumovozyma dairenensis CBS 421]